MTGLYVGQAIGGFGATIAALFSWHTTFHWFGFIGMGYSLVLMLALRENPVRVEEEADGCAGSRKTLVVGRTGHAVLHVGVWIILFYFAVPDLPGWATRIGCLHCLPIVRAFRCPRPDLLPLPLAVSSFIGVIVGGILSDRWVQKNIRGRVYAGIGLGMTIPALVLLGFGHSFVAVVGAGLLFGVGYGIFDANNMPILCQFVPARLRGTAWHHEHGGVFAGAAVTQLLGKWTDGGSLGQGFAMLGGVVLVALALQVLFLRPTTDNME